MKQSYRVKENHMEYSNSNKLIKTLSDKIKEKVKKEKYVLTYIPHDGINPGYCFTTGLKKSYKMPELILFGLPQTLSYLSIEKCIELLIETKKIETYKKFYGITGDSPVMFLEVLERSKIEFMKITNNYYGEEDYDALQLVWADTNGKFPFEEKYNRAYASAQPLTNIVDYKRWIQNENY